MRITWRFPSRSHQRQNAAVGFHPAVLGRLGERHVGEVKSVRERRLLDL
jgi:hypothetical protein